MTAHVLFLILLILVLFFLIRTSEHVYDSIVLTWKTVTLMLELGLAIGCVIAMICVTLYLQYVAQQSEIQSIPLNEEQITQQSNQVETQENLLILPTKTIKL
jgi:hypothetical protein